MVTIVKTFVEYKPLQTILLLLITVIRYCGNCDVIKISTLKTSIHLGLARAGIFNSFLIHSAILMWKAVRICLMAVRSSGQLPLPSNCINPMKFEKYC